MGRFPSRCDVRRRPAPWLVAIWRIRSLDTFSNLAASPKVSQPASSGSVERLSAGLDIVLPSVY